MEIKRKKRREKEIEVLLDQENVRWKQRTKKHWLKDGDRNTKFFHTCANQRKRKNAIMIIQDQHGNEVVECKQIEKAFRLYFVKVYKTSNPTT